MNPIRVLHIISGLASGGRERQLFEVIKNIDKSKISSGVITFNTNQRYNILVKDSIQYYKELNKKPTRLEPLFSIWKCFREFRPDIVHSWDSLSSFYAYLPKLFWNIKFIEGSIRDSGTEKNINYHFRRFFLSRADVVISNSYAGLKAYNCDGVVLYNSIDLQRFKKPVNHSGLNLIMVANFTAYKDHVTFIRAAIHLIKDQTVKNVYLLGDGPNKQKYFNFIKNDYPEHYNQFYFPGSVTDVEDYLSLCRIGILCSTKEFGEGLSNSVLEYMAAGLVPIVTDIGGSCEIIEEGKNGYLIKPEDSDKIVELVHLLNKNPDLQERLIANAKQTIKMKFDLSKNLFALTNIYLTLVKRRSNA